MDDDTRAWGLVRWRKCLMPTMRGWLVLVVILAALTTLAVREIHPFLAITDPLPGGYLVVEGWAPDYTLRQAISEVHRNHYEKVLVTGGPLLWGAPLSEFKTYAEMAAATLEKLGLSTNMIQAVPSQSVLHDRTYAAALSLGAWLRTQPTAPTKVHLMTEGAHARRSRLLFQKALGKDIAVGVTAVPLPDYDPQHWWRYSSGVRAVIDETVAYIYARLFFHPRINNPSGITEPSG